MRDMDAFSCKSGTKNIVSDIKLNTNLERRLETLGLTAGTSFEILNKKRNGAIIIKVRGTRFAIGKDIAKGICIERSDNI